MAMPDSDYSNYTTVWDADHRASLTVQPLSNGVEIIADDGDVITLTLNDYGVRKLRLALTRYEHNRSH